MGNNTQESLCQKRAPPIEHLYHSPIYRCSSKFRRRKKSKVKKIKEQARGRKRGDALRMRHDKDKIAASGWLVRGEVSDTAHEYKNKQKRKEKKGLISSLSTDTQTSIYLPIHICLYIICIQMPWLLVKRETGSFFFLGTMQISISALFLQLWCKLLKMMTYHWLCCVTTARAAVIPAKLITKVFHQRLGISNRIIHCGDGCSSSFDCLSSASLPLNTHRFVASGSLAEYLPWVETQISSAHFSSSWTASWEWPTFSKTVVISWLIYRRSSCWPPGWPLATKSNGMR